MLNIIKIRKATFYAYHGVLSEEQSVGGKFEADVDIYTDFSEAAESDNLRLTVDYLKVYKFINNLVHEKKYYLIESVAFRIAKELLKNFPDIQKVNVKVRKNNPPVGGVIDYVETEVELSKDGD